MVARIRDLIDDAARVEVFCAQCGSVTILTGAKLLGSWGWDTSVREAQSRLRCRRCGMRGSLRITYPDEALAAERLARRLPLHGD